MKNISLALLSLLLALEFSGYAQLPVLKTRFANPQYNCSAQTYSLDVEFQSNTPSQKLYGMNVRFFYDDVILEFQSMGNFVSGYSQVAPLPAILTTSSSTGGSAMFGFPTAHPFEFCNGAIQLTGATSLYLSTTGWTRIFTVWFHVDDPAALNIASFSPSVIWDLEVNPANGGWLNGDDGVVMCVAALPPAFSSPTTENVVQYNWQYSGLPGTPYGLPAITNSISTLTLTAAISSSSTPICSGSSNGSATVTANGGTPPYTYAWNTFPVLTTATATGLSAGNYSVTVSDAFNCSTTASVTISQIPAPLTFSVTGSGSYCSMNAGIPIGLDGSQTGVNYTLTPGGTVVPGTGGALDFGLHTAQIYTITGLDATTGCSKAMIGSAVITASAPPPVGITITTNANPIATDEAVTINAYPTNGGSSPFYQWKVNGENAGLNEPTFTYSPVDGDAVNCILTSSEYCVSGNPATSNTIFMSVQNIAPNQTVTGVFVSGESNCHNAIQTLTVAGNGSNYLLMSGASVTMIAGQSIKFLPGTTVLSGSYLHGYITLDNQYCGQQTTSLPSTVTGVSEPSTSNLPSGFTIYPNPAVDNFTVAQTSEKSYNNVEIQIYGTRGERLKSICLQGKIKHLCSIPELAHGLYFVKIVADGSVESFKLIKIK